MGTREPVRIKVCINAEVDRLWFVAVFCELGLWKRYDGVASVDCVFGAMKNEVNERACDLKGRFGASINSMIDCSN